jgi:hypothetical protein
MSRRDHRRARAVRRRRGPRPTPGCDTLAETFAGAAAPPGGRVGADFPVDNPAAAATYRFCKLLAI